MFKKNCNELLNFGITVNITVSKRGRYDLKKNRKGKGTLVKTEQ
jgi:hypothetical protein